MASFLEDDDEEDSLTSRIAVAEACSRADYERAQELMAAGSDPVTSRFGYFNWSPLHYTAKQGKLDFAQMLILQYSCHPMVEDKEGRTPLHVACQHGQLEYARYLVKQKRCDVHYGDVEDLIPLYHACGWLSECTDEQALTMAKFLVINGKCDPSTRDMNGKNGILHASEKGFVSVLRYFIEECRCDVGVVDYRENNPLHLAVSFSNKFEVVKYLIGLEKLDITSTNNKGNNVLHMAGIANSSMDICKLIVESVDSSTLESLLEAKNFKDDTPINLASPGLLQYLLCRYKMKDPQYYNKYLISLGMKQPSNSTIKILVLGDKDAGKSTLVRSLQKESSSFSSSFSRSFSAHSQPSSPVVPRKNSIVTISEFKSKFYGEIQFYDLDGNIHGQYVNDTLMPHAIQAHLTVFLIVIDFSKPIKDIYSSLQQWLSFIGRISKAEAKPKVLVLGSHADIVKSEIKFHDTRSPREKLKQLSLDDDSLDYEFVAKLLLDCQKTESSGMNMLRKHLTTQCDLIREDKELPFLSSCLLSFIKRSYDSTSLVSLRKLVEAVNSYVVEEKVVYDLRYFVSDDISILVPLLDDLNKSGHLLFMKNEADLKRSLIVPDLSQLCSDFAEAISNSGKHNAFKNSQHSLFTLSNVEPFFPDLDPLDVLQMLSYLGLAVSSPDMSSRFALISTEDQQFYYCPSFLHNASPPKNIWDVRSTYSFHFGWRMERKSSSLFTMHFVHHLLLHIFSFVISLTRVKRFAIWKRGLHFECDLQGIEVLVESSDDMSGISFIMRSRELTSECARCRSTIIRTVRKTFEKYYGSNNHNEFVMDPFHSRRYPLMPRECLTLFNSSQMLHSIQSGRKIAESTDGISVAVEELLMFEPLLSIGAGCLSILQKAERTGNVSGDFLTCLAGNISSGESKLLKDVFSVQSEDSSHELSLNLSQTYEDILQQIGTFTSLDLSLFYQKSDHSPQYFKFMT